MISSLFVFCGDRAGQRKAMMKRGKRGRAGGTINEAGQQAEQAHSRAQQTTKVGLTRRHDGNEAKAGRIHRQLAHSPTKLLAFTHLLLARFLIQPVICLFLTEDVLL